MSINARGILGISLATALGMLGQQPQPDGMLFRGVLNIIAPKTRQQVYAELISMLHGKAYEKYQK